MFKEYSGVSRPPFEILDTATPIERFEPSLVSLDQITEKGLVELNQQSSSESPEVIMSIKPHFSNLIFQGEKDFELRRVAPRVPSKSLAFVYESAPTKALVGAFEIVKIFHLPLEELWALVSRRSGTTYERFMEYFTGKDAGNAIQIGWRTKLKSPIGLDRIRGAEDGFRPPQNYMFLSRGKALFRVLKRECPHFF